MAYLLRAVATLAEELGSISTIHLSVTSVPGYPVSPWAPGHAWYKDIHEGKTLMRIK